ncbi:hypothetical protein ACFQZJ_00285 [Maribacter chungangensis]|uniref:DUF1129 domain-containing protein n=1 Tax=Maribacter chungangensis TaxID=1069117 RepID=A0ABW3AYM0_9FLAO
MKVSQEQYQKIEVYLKTKGIHQIDLKYEILDHILLGTEGSMETDGLCFEEAFALEKIKWQSELDAYTMAEGQVHFKTPKIVLRRYWLGIKEMYIKAGIMTLGALLPLIVFIKTDLVPIATFHTLFGYFYVFAFTAIALLFLKMRAKGKNTTDKMMFKASMGYFMAWLVVFNPLLGNLYWVRQEGEFMAVFFGIHVFLLCFSFNFIDLYKAHVKKVKMYSL